MGRRGGSELVFCRFSFPGGDPRPEFLYELDFMGVKGLPIFYNRAVSLVEFRLGHLKLVIR